MGTAKIIGITGFAGAGKSEVAKHLVGKHSFTPMKFAQALKDMLRALGLSERELEGDLKNKPCKLLCGKTPRYAMITLGTEWGRKLIGDDLWVNVLKRKITNLERMYKSPKVVVDDCRFKNEAAMIQTKGGDILEVIRPGVSAVANHQSELEHLEFTGVEIMNNDEGIETLRNLVDSFMED